MPERKVDPAKKTLSSKKSKPPEGSSVPTVAGTALPTDHANTTGRAPLEAGPVISAREETAEQARTGSVGRGSAQNGRISSTRKAGRINTNLAALFTYNQIAEFKEVFRFIDQDKDGFLSKSDIRASFEQVGRAVSDSELDDMLAQAAGAINFTQFLEIFGNRLAGMDEEDTIFNAFAMFDEGEELCSKEKMRELLSTFGEQFSDQELNDALAQAPMDSCGRIKLRQWASMLTGGGIEDSA